MTRYKLHVSEWSIGENVIEVQLRLYWSAMPASSTENATTSLENLHGTVNEVSCHFENMTHSRMCVKENSGWSIVSNVLWMFRVLESSNVASML